jgi:hypothetical protein
VYKSVSVCVRGASSKVPKQWISIRLVPMYNEPVFMFAPFISIASGSASVKLKLSTGTVYGCRARFTDGVHVPTAGESATPPGPDLSLLPVT